MNVMDKIFQKFCDILPHYLVRHNFLFKKIFYLFFLIFKLFLKGPIILNFKNFKINAFPQKKDYSRYLFTRGDLPDLTEINFIIKKINKKKSLFIDCGFNFGSYSIPIAASNKNCDVYAFDASKLIQKSFINNLKLNKLNNIFYENTAVGNNDKKIIFHEEIFNKKINPSGSGYIINKIKDKKLDYKINMITLDNYFKKKKLNKYNIIIIKIDLEGNDIEAIYGAKNIIKKHKPIILFEFSRMIINNKNYNFTDFNKFIVKNNLKLVDLNYNKIKLKDLHIKIDLLSKRFGTIGNFLLLDKSYKVS